jgi:hypothetical protein
VEAVNLRLGNLTVKQFAARVGSMVSEADEAELESYRTNDASFTDPTKFHIFSDPAPSIVIGADALTATLPIWQRMHREAPFDREVGFYSAAPVATPSDAGES